jgi:hypothetical protein
MNPATEALAFAREYLARAKRDLSSGYPECASARRRKAARALRIAHRLSRSHCRCAAASSHETPHHIAAEGESDDENH